MVTALAFRDFKYYVSEAAKSLWYNKVMALTSMITVMGSLLLLGFFLIIAININAMTVQIEDQCEIQAYLALDISDEDAQSVYQQISSLQGVKSVTFVSREQAFEDYKTTFADKAVALDGMSADVLPDTCRIVAEDLRQLQPLIESVGAIQGVDEVASQRETVDKVILFTSGLRKICIFSTILLAIIAVFIISNTIKLDVHSRQKEIHIMKYVGATDWFIRWPFIIEGIFVGILGAVISIILLMIGLSVITKSLSQFFTGMFSLQSVGQTMPSVSLILVCFGIIIGALGSLIAVRKHLHV